MANRQMPKVKRKPTLKTTAEKTATGKELLSRAVLLEQARASLWEYQKLRDQKFFRESRAYLNTISIALQDVFERKRLKADGTPYRKVVLSIPPRHGKSYSIAGFCQWALGRRHDTRIAEISYNDILTGRFSQGVRDVIDERKATDDQIVYGDVFPETELKYGDSARRIWALDGEHFSFLATSFGGTMTGVGFNIGIIDDPIKLPEEALNDEKLDAQWDWYVNAYLSRLEEDAMQIIVMTRWATRDLAGRVQEEEPGEWLEIKMEAQDEKTGEMLCSEILSKATYESRKRLASKSDVSMSIFDANYHQKPVDAKDKLYGDFQTYRMDELPRDEKGRIKWDVIAAYGDTADQGHDFLCLLIFGVIAGQAYVLDILYTDRPMEYTEPEAARRLFNNSAQIAKIESNNGGRGYARAVRELLWRNYKTRSIKIDWFTQTQNKNSRIQTNAAYVCMNIFYPDGWEQRYPNYAAAMKGYKRKGRNSHDDAPDATTGVAEMLIEGIKTKTIFGYRILDM